MTEALVTVTMRPLMPHRMNVVASLDTGEFGATVWFHAVKDDAALELHLESWIAGHEEIIFALQRKMKKVNEVERDEYGCHTAEYVLDEDSR